MDLHPGRIYRVMSPAQDAPITETKDLLDLDVGKRLIAEQILEKPRYFTLSRKQRAVRGRSRIFKHAIVAHETHHAFDIMPVEGLVELEDDSDR
jgi:hypothetical protein